MRRRAMAAAIRRRESKLPIAMTFPLAMTRASQKSCGITIAISGRPLTFTARRGRRIFRCALGASRMRCHGPLHRVVRRKHTAIDRVKLCEYSQSTLEYSEG